MSINSINSFNSQLSLVPKIETQKDSHQVELDEKLEAACKDFNMAEITALVQQGADPSTNIVINLIGMLKVASQMKDFTLLKELIKEFPVSLPDLECLSEESQIYVARFTKCIEEMGGLPLETSRKIVDVVSDFLPMMMTEEEIEDECPAFDSSLIELAVSVRDLNLVKALVEKGVKPTDEELECSNLISVEEFSETSSKIVECLIENGLRLEQFLEEDESLKSLMRSALREGNENLVNFLEKHGVSSNIGSGQLVQLGARHGIISKSQKEDFEAFAEEYYKAEGL